MGGVARGEQRAPRCRRLPRGRHGPGDDRRHAGRGILAGTLARGRLGCVRVDESGRAEVYVRPFPHADSARVQVSVAGGIEPVWAPSGPELFYRDAAFDLVAVEVTLTPSFRLGPQRRLFSTRPYYVEGLHAA